MDLEQRVKGVGRFLKMSALATGLFFLTPKESNAQQTDYDTLKIATYNLLNYPGTDTTTRNPYFRTVTSSMSPDILVTQEMTSQAGVDGIQRQSPEQRPA